MSAKCSESSLKEYVDKLKELSRQHRGSILSIEGHRLVSELKSSVLRHTSPTHAFCILGGPQQLLQLLSQCACSGQDAVLLLGLLGNVCALDKDTRDVVMGEHKLVVGILTDATQCEVLNTAARLVANLALDHTHIAPLLADGVVPCLVQSLVRGTNPCKRSVLRALRLLAASGDCRDEVSSVDGVGTIAECLQSCDPHVTAAAIQTLQAVMKDNENVSALCTKTTLQLVIRHCHHQQPVVCLSALRVLVATAKCSDGRVALSNAGGIETLVGLMERYDSERAVLREVVCALCMCCSDVISRQRLRDCGGLSQLITMLTSDTHIGLHGNILSALICYYFDEVSLKAMVKSMGLLPVLVYHLTKKDAESASEESSEAGSTQRGVSPLGSEVGSTQRDVSPLGSEVGSTQRGVSPLGSELEFESSSPGPSNLTPVGVAPNHQPHPPSAQQELPFIHPEDLDPVTTPPSNKRPRLEVDLNSSTPVPPNFLDSLLSSPNPYAVEERTCLSARLPPPLAYQVIQLLSRVSHLRECHPLLSAPETLSPILTSFTSSDPPSLPIHKVLSRVFSNPHCFQDALLCHAPSTLHQCVHHRRERVLSQQCGELLDRLSKVAESPYGHGVLAHLLLRGEEKEKQASALALPLLCRTMRVCKTLLLTHRGFNELSLLAGTNGELQSMAIEALLALALNTLPPPPTPSSTQQLPPTPHLSLPSHCHYTDSDHCPFDLVWVVCGGGRSARVPVHRRVMVEASDVFGVMLEGGYKEAGQDEVTLRDTPPHSFVAVVHYLYGCGWDCGRVPTYPTTPTAEGEVLETSEDIIDFIASCVCEGVEEVGRVCDGVEVAALCLRVMVCAGLFLLDDLFVLCQHVAVQYVLPSNVVEMFYFARMYECYCLSESCIRIVMTMGEQRREVFRDLVTSYVGDTVLSMLRMFLSMS